MATIADNLLALQETKENFKTAFAEKEVDLTGVPFTEYPNKFSEIKTSEDLDTELTEQETLLADLEADVNALSDKPTDMLQQVVDGTNSCRNLFYQCGVTNLDLSKLDTSKVTNMNYMFNECTRLTSLNVSNFNTSNVNNMSWMFYALRELTNLIGIENFDTSNVTTMDGMFTSCSKLTSLDVSKFDTSKVTAMKSMFNYCSALTSLDVSKFDTSKVTAMKSMFTNCSQLTSLDVSKFDTSNVTSMYNMFAQCSSLTSLDLSKFDTSNVTDMGGMFYLCSKLVTIVGKLNAINVTTFYNTFASCGGLTDVTLLNVKKSLTLGSGTSYGTLLSNATLINTIQQLWDLTGSTSQKLTLSTTSKNNIANIYVKLVDVTDEMLAEDKYIANKKPCVVCESTDEGAMTLTEYAISKNWAIA